MRILGALLAVAVLMPNGVQGQGIGVAAVGGKSNYDLSGVGWTTAVGLRVDVPLSRHFVLEPGVTYMTDRPEFERRFRLIMPEAQLQFTPLSGRIRPYLGVGAGFARELLDDVPDATEATLSAALGARIDLAVGWGLVAESRLRAVKPFTGSTADLLIGLRRRIL